MVALRMDWKYALSLAPEDEGFDYSVLSQFRQRLIEQGAEDLVLLFSTGDSAPRPARGTMLGDRYSVAVALEYRGHWARVMRGLPQ